VVDDVAALLARDELDAVTICTPNDAHPAVALAAFAAGKHVFCEKPLGRTVAEAAAMAAAAAASGRVHLVAFTYRYLDGVAELRRRVAAGDVGEPVLFRAHHEFWEGHDAEIGWRELRAPSGGGVLYDSGSHFFDLARFALGPIATVRGQTLQVPRTRRERTSGELRAVETDDLATAWFRFAGGAAGHWHASRVTPPSRDNHVQVVGRDGALDALLSRGRLDALRLARPGQRGWQELPLPVDPRRPPGDQAHALGAMGAMMRAFVDACLAGVPSPGDATFADGLAVQRLVDAAERSASAGWLDLDPPA
jgi:predicted dehydrogenase